MAAAYEGSAGLSVGSAGRNASLGPRRVSAAAAPGVAAGGTSVVPMEPARSGALKARVADAVEGA